MDGFRRAVYESLKRFCGDDGANLVVEKLRFDDVIVLLQKRQQFV